MWIRDYSGRMRFVENINNDKIYYENICKLVSKKYSQETPCCIKYIKNLTI